MTNTLVWFGLVSITLTAVWAESFSIEAWLYTVLILAGIKFLAIGLQFMDIRDAHPLWILWLIVLLLVFVIGVFWFRLV